MDPERLQHYGLTAALVAQKLKEENIELLGGRVTSLGQEFLTRTLAQYQNLEERKRPALATFRLLADHAIIAASRTGGALDERRWTAGGVAQAAGELRTR